MCFFLGKIWILKLLVINDNHNIDNDDDDNGGNVDDDDDDSPVASLPSYSPCSETQARWEHKQIQPEEDFGIDLSLVTLIWHW